jgi:ASCH domain-containing protein
METNPTSERKELPPLSPAICSTVKALSIRQPWAWLIVNGWKNIENRNWNTSFRGRFLVHASKGMTAAEYEDAKNFALSINPKIPVPDFGQLERGGIVGDVELATTILVDDIAGQFADTRDYKNASKEDRHEWQNSKWLVGQFGFCLRCARTMPFQPVKGALGFFNPWNDPR